MRFLLLAICLVVSGLSARCATAFSLMGSTNLNLHGQGTTNQAWWYEYLGGDAQLDHGFMGLMVEGPYTNLVGQIQLGTNIPAGTYSLLLKTQQYPSGGLYPTFRLQAGSADVSWAYLASAELGGQWTLPKFFTSATSFSNITLTVFRTFPTNQLQQMVLMGLHINSTTNVLLDKFDRIVDLTTSGTVTTNTVAGNLIDNSSFELGMDRGWWNETSDARTNLSSMVSTNEAHTGTKSVVVRYGEAVSSRFYHLRPNATYVVSAWAKTASGTRSVRIGLYHPFTPYLPSGYPSSFPSLQATTVGTNWTRIYATNVVREAAGSRLFVRVEAAANATNLIYLDDVQLEEAPAPSTFALRSPIEVAIGTTNALAVYIDGTESNATVRAYNSGSSTALALGYETRDHLNAIVASGAFSMTASNGLSEVVRSIHPGRRGNFSLLVTNSEAMSDEFAFSVVPSPRALGTNSAVGSHGTVNRGDYYIEGTRRTGGAWFRGLSHAGFFRWDQLEPTNGVWDWSWSDQQMSRVTNNASIQLMGVLYERAPWSSDVPVTADWLDYVTNVVARYPMVQYWEIDNEPFAGMTPAEYVIMLTNSVNAIKAIQPSARIIALGGASYNSWVTNLLALLPVNYLTNVYAASIHVYPAFPATAVVDSVRTLVSSLSPHRVWNTETGSKTVGRRLGLDANFTRYSGNAYTHKDSLALVQDLVWATDNEIQNHLNSLGLGCEVVFNYDSRLPANVPPDHQYSDIDIDDSVKLGGTQRAALAWMIDGTTNRFEASHAGVRLYAFQRRDGGIVAGHYTDTNVTLTVTVPLTNQFWTVDSVGNMSAPAGSTFRSSHRVEYLVATNATWSAWTNALALATQAPWTDTNAPNIAMLPTDTYSGKRVATWVAVDDSDFPIENTPNAVLYSYRVDGGSWSDWSPTSYVEPATNASTVEARAKDTAGNISSTVLRAFSSTPAPVLLVLIEPTARGYAGEALERVIREDRRAGWNVIVREIPRWTGTWATNDWRLLNIMSNEVRRFCTTTNDAVILFGKLPFLQTGGHQDDGHYLRRVATDGWLGCSSLELTDTGDWMALGMDSSDIMASNRVADGFPDQLNGTFFIPVTRVDASDMGALPTNYVYASGYLAGQQFQPAINEGYWLRNYLTNVWQYQTRQWTVTETGLIDNGASAWSTGSSGIQSANSAITWTANSTATAPQGGTYRFVYDANTPELWSPDFITSGGTPLRAFWIITYKSYEMEVWNAARPPMRRLFPGVINQPFSLVASWCRGNLASPYFRSRASDSTVFDVIRSSAAGTVDFRYNVYGWGTLVVDQPTTTKLGTATGNVLTIP